MVEIKLIDNYYLRSDANSWILSVKKETKGKQYWNDVGFFARLTHLLRSLLEQSLRLSEATTLDELIHDAHETKKALQKLLEAFSDFDKILNETLENRIKRIVKEEMEGRV